MKAMRPDIYPRNVENIKAVLLYYFPDVSHSEINTFSEIIYDNRKIKLNELEFIAEKIHSNVDFFYGHFNVNYINKLETFIGTVYEALFTESTEWTGSKNRLTTLKKVKEQLKN